jgi:lysozyme
LLFCVVKLLGIAHTELKKLLLNKYFPGAILLTTLSYYSCLVAIAEPQIRESSNNLQPIPKTAETTSSNFSSIGDLNAHQELNEIAQVSLITATLDGKLKTPIKSVSKEVSPNTLALIQEFEGFRSTAYIDTDGTPVIGYGQSKIQGKPVQLGDRISPAVANEALKTDLAKIQQEILTNVKVELNNNQLSALISLAFNAGVENLHTSTLVRKLNQKDYLGAANEFLRWDKANIRGKIVKMDGLAKRRAREKQLFLTKPKLTTPLTGEVSSTSLIATVQG